MHVGGLQRVRWVQEGPQRVRRVQEGLERGYLKEDGLIVEEQGQEGPCPSAESLV